MNINIEIIPQKEHRFTTIGDWWVDENGNLQVKISKMADWRYEIAVLFHELIEFFICKHLGITTEECDEFDAFYETQYEQGIIDRSKEAGFDKRCPYRKGHIWGARFERMIVFLLGASWKKYIKDCDDLMQIR